VLQVFSHCSLYLSNKATREEILEELKAYIERTPSADSYFGYGFCMRLLEGHTMEEAAALLDLVHRKTPIVLLSDGGNGVWLNTVAIEAVRQSAEKDMIQNINLPYILFSVAPFDNAALEKEAILLGEKYKRLGFTSVLSCGEPDYMQGIYQQCLVDLYQCETHLQRFF
jgi:predicted amidohydrolase YtcJ